MEERPVNRTELQSELSNRILCADALLHGDSLDCFRQRSVRCCPRLRPWPLYNAYVEVRYFSTQAAYAAPLVLLAQTRQAARDRMSEVADAKHREELSQRALEQGRQLEQLLRQKTELTAAVHDPDREDS